MRNIRFPKTAVFLIIDLYAVPLLCDVFYIYFKLKF